MALTAASAISRPCWAFYCAAFDISTTFSADSLFCFTLSVTCSILLVVSSSDAACSSVQLDNSIFPVAISFALLPGYVIFTSVVCYAYYRKVAGKDRVTSYFASMPGGLSDMVLLGEAFGGDVRQIALSHSVRILVVVTAVALFFGLFLDVSSQSAARG